MDVKIIKKALRDYKRKKSAIETASLRVETFKEVINDPESYTHMFMDIDKEDALDQMRESIRDDLAMIYSYRTEIEQIDAALGALNKQQRYIIYCKYFEKMLWRDIEIKFNDQFRVNNYITVSGIRKLNRKAMGILAEILKPYY